MPLPTSLVVKNGSKTRVEHVGRHAGAGVGDREQHVVAGRGIGIARDIVLVERGVARLDQQPAAVRHGVARVDAEIDQRRLELGAVDVDTPQAVGEDGCDLDLLAQRAPQQLAGAGHQLVDVGELRPQRLLAREGQQLARQLGGALRGAVHPIEAGLCVSASRPRPPAAPRCWP